MESIGGFTIIRRLGSGSRSDVFLGRTEPLGGDGVPGTAAIKVYHPAVPRSSIDLEIDALTRTAHRHVVRLDDLAMTPSGQPALVLARLGPVSLARIIADARRIEPGELVTVVAPLASAVRVLHGAGVAHRRVQAGRVLFDDSGAPVMTGFGDAEILAPAPVEGSVPSLSPDALARSAAVGDVADLLVLVRAVIGLVTLDARIERLLSWIDGPACDLEPDRVPLELETRLFDIAEPMALGHGLLATDSAGHGRDRLEPSFADLVSTVGDHGLDPPLEDRPSRPRRSTSTARSAARVRRGSHVGPASTGRQPDSDDATPGRGASARGSARAGRRDGGPARGERQSALARAHTVSRSTALDALGLPVWIESIVHDARRSGAVAAMTMVAVRANRTLATVRRPVWLLAGGVGLALVAALVFVPEGDGTEAVIRDEDRSSDSSYSEGSPDESPVDPVATSSAPGEAMTARGDEKPAGARASEADLDAAIEADEPIAAAAALLQRRSECLRDLSILCLDAVDQPGSAALDADAFAIRQVQAGGPPDAAATVAPVISVVERLGDSVILSVNYGGTDAGSGSVSTLLIVRSEDGWRIRDLFDA